MLAQEWKALDEKQKGKFYSEAEHLKNLHQLQHPDYKYVRYIFWPNCHLFMFFPLSLCFRYSPRARKPNLKRGSTEGPPAQTPPPPGMMLIQQPQQQQQQQQLSHLPQLHPVPNPIIIPGMMQPLAQQQQQQQHPVGAYQQGSMTIVPPPNLPALKRIAPTPSLQQQQQQQQQQMLRIPQLNMMQFQRVEEQPQVQIQLQPAPQQQRFSLAGGHRGGSGAVAVIPQQEDSFQQLQRAAQAASAAAASSMNTEQQQPTNLILNQFQRDQNGVIEINLE